MTNSGRGRFCANEMFETIVREHAPPADGFRGEALLFRYLVDREAKGYSDAVELFRQSVEAAGHKASPYEVKQMPARLEAVTNVRKTDTGEWIEIRFFNVFPSVPDAVLNSLAVALTVGGLVTAPLTSGTSILISCIAMGFAIANNAKKETDPIRIAIYRAIGTLASKKAQDISHANYPLSALSKDELADVLDMTRAKLEERLPEFTENVVLVLENEAPPEHYRQSSVFSSSDPEEYRQVQVRVEKACVRKWDQMNRTAWVFPSLEEIAQLVNTPPDVGRQALAVLVEKRVVSTRHKDARTGYWYTT